MRTMRKVLLVCFLMLFPFVRGLFPCAMVLAGKKATADGSVLLAHNNDLNGEIASLLQIVPGGKHTKGEKILFKNGLTIPQAPETYRMLIMQCYYGFAEGDAKAVNQYKVAVAGGTSFKEDRNDNARRLDPLIKNGVSGYIRYIALQRSKTARECVELIGKIYSEYGISYPSGVGVADENEVWYLETGGGKCWAAQRVPDDSYLVAVNEYRIGEIDFNDKENFILPPYLKSYAVEKGLWKPGAPGTSGFNFAEIFGGKKRRGKVQPYYNARRVWRAQALLTPSLKQDAREFIFPFTLRPDKKLTVPDLIRVLRDNYGGTPFGPVTGLDINKDRPIATFNTEHTSVVQLRPDLPADVGAVIWGGLSTALTTPYIPFYFGIQKIPAHFDTAGVSQEDRAADERGRAAAYWQFKQLKKRLIKNFPNEVKKVTARWEELEKDFFQQQDVVIQGYKRKLKQSDDAAQRFLTATVESYARRALERSKLK